jgi:hypothetical protein
MEKQQEPEHHTLSCLSSTTSPSYTTPTMKMEKRLVILAFLSHLFYIQAQKNEISDRTLSTPNIRPTRSNRQNEGLLISRPLLKFNVTLIGTKDQFDIVTLSIVKDALESLLSDGLIEIFEPLSHVTLRQDSRSNLFPGSLVNIISYSGQAFFLEYESFLNTREVQKAQLQVLEGADTKLADLLLAQDILIPVDGIILPSAAENKDDEEEPALASIQESESRNKKIPAAAWATVMTIATLVSIAFARYVRQKSREIQANQGVKRSKQASHRTDDAASDSTLHIPIPTHV